MRNLLPFILLVAAVGLFFGWTDGVYQGSKDIAAQTVAYDQALTTANQLKTQRDQLLAKRATFSTDDIQKLERMLPNNVDNIRLIIDINSIAARHALTIKNVSLGSVSSAAAPRSGAAVGASGDPVGSVELGFTVTASYNTFLAFLTDLEHSLRIVDVEKLTFKNANSTDSIDYTFTIRTYWLH